MFAPDNDPYVSKHVAYYAWLQTSAAKQLRTEFFCVITQRVVVISYRRFGTTYRSLTALTTTLFSI